MTIYRRDNTWSSIATFQDAYSFNLEYQSNLYLWSREELIVKSLSMPILRISASDEAILTTELNLTATSRNDILGTEVNCTVRLSSRPISRNSIDIHNTKA